MDFTAGVSVAALTFACTAGFVKYESTNLRDDIKQLFNAISYFAKSKQLDIKLDRDIKQLDIKMDRLL